MNSTDNLAAPMHQQRFSSYSRPSESHGAKTSLNGSYSELVSSCNGESNYLKRINTQERKEDQPVFYASAYFPSAIEPRLIDRLSRPHTKVKKPAYENCPSLRFSKANFHSPKVIKPFSRSMLKQIPSPMKVSEIKTPKANPKKEFNRRIDLHIALDKFVEVKKSGMEEKKHVTPCTIIDAAKPKTAQCKTPVKIIIEREGILHTKSSKEIMKEYEQLSKQGKM
eukprot:TRINITY_DN4649_c0_g1_i10.p1 TRINITY_DN4649_c0_g1~~TRINITY_DN4649_c0_g1_i10.p1  ORF type:complete len:224 (+),score=29.25 TRINITY_DN4649_c0_g1_i10:156-827(+)